MKTAILICLTALVSAGASPAETAAEILKATGVQGGLVVHLQCGDGSRTADLHANDSYLVHGLDTDPANVAAARGHVTSRGLYGKVSVDRWDGASLPYTENLVNLVVGDPDKATRDEILRVLSPGGVAYLKKDGGWEKIVKAVPDEIDEWTHFLHGPDNNAVADDTVVGSPRHLQWIGGPRWARGHEVLATISAAVTSGGRMFYIADEGPTASVDLPSSWVLVARDAFNGVLLWKRSIPDWEPRFRPFRSGPAQLPRRLVAIGDRVYVTLGYGSPVSALDAATGDAVQVYKGTEGADEIVVSDKTMFLVIGDTKEQLAATKKLAWKQEESPDKRLMAVNVDTGEVLWERDDEDTKNLFAQSLAVSGGRAFFQNTGRIVALDAASGEEKWKVDRPASTSRPGWSVPTLVAHGEVVISADRNAPAGDAKGGKVKWSIHFGGGGSPGEMVAYYAKDGKKLWSQKCKEGYNSPVDVLIADGLVWSGDLVKAGEPGITVARDPLSGNVKRERPADKEFFSPGMSHHRCYRNKATTNFVLLGRSGVEMLNLKTGVAEPNHWIRGTCQYGVIPANGLVYVPPHTCACYLKTKLNGFNALAPQKPDFAEVPPDGRLVRGPAFGFVRDPVKPDPEDWPTYRRTPERSGSSATKIAPDLKRAWTAELGGDLSPPVSAEGMVFVAQKTVHAIQALDGGTGEKRWRFIAGGRIDSPPTIHRGTVIFGSVDGWVYNLRASDGALIWKFLAQPQDRRVVVDNGLESAWPVSGSVLVQNDTAYFAAGRSAFLDGGIRLYALDPATGAVKEHTIFTLRNPETKAQPREVVKGFDMESGLADVLSGDGEFIYMRDVQFDAKLTRQPGGGTHLFSPTGFLDESWWHRTYWMFGSQFKSGWGNWNSAGNAAPSGRILAFDEDSIYGFGRNFLPRGNAGQWKQGEKYRLYGAEKTVASVSDAPKSKKKPRPKKGAGAKKAAPPKKPAPSIVRWSQTIDPEVRAMVLAGDTLFVAGPHGATHRSLEAFNGENGISFDAFSTADGAKLSALELDAMPIFDGMIAANQRIYLVTRSGEVRCYSGEDR